MAEASLYILRASEVLAVLERTRAARRIGLSGNPICGFVFTKIAGESAGSTAEYWGVA